VKSFLAVLIAVAMIAGLGLRVFYVHSRRQLSALDGQQAYPSPETGMRDRGAQQYEGLDWVEIIHAGNEPCFLTNLYFVEARVWADGRADGQPVGDEGDNPGGFFLHRDEGWVWVPEDALPWFVAIGLWLFGDS
jgi:hypothetical protein